MRTDSKALVSGAISDFGAKFLLNLNAFACGSGTLLASQQIEAARTEDFLRALSRAAAKLRSELGESLPSVQKY